MRINDKTLIAFANSPSPADKVGLLLKKGEVNKGYQKRWFVLKGNLLFYYEKKSDKEPVGVIVLEDCTIECSDVVDGFAFMINFPGSQTRTYLLSAETQEEMESWMKAMSRASYEYMKLLVSDLQRKLDEINKAETSKLVQLGSRASQNVSRTYSEAFRSSDVDIAEEALISFGDHSSGSDSQTSTPSARFNPFDAGAMGSTSWYDNQLDSEARCVIQAPMRKAVRLPAHGPRSFIEMHEEFGQLIREKLKLVSVSPSTDL